MTLPLKFAAGIIVSILSFALILGGMQGCEDASAKQRDELQKTIADASRELQLALATSSVTGTESDDDLQVKLQKLSGIVSKLSSAGQGGEPGQIAAKALLAGSAQRELASIRLSQARRIEAEHEMIRDELDGKIQAIMSLNALASGIESADAKAERDQLTEALESARNRSTELTNKVKQLSGPIEEQSQAIAASQKEVDALKLEVSNLRRKANELGHADGFDTYKRSAAISRDADKIEYDIAQREVDLDYALTPEHKFADDQLKQLQALLESVQGALDLLNTFKQTSGTNVKDIRTRIEAFSSDVSKGISAMNQSAEHDLKPAYDEALESLDKAGKQVEAATRPPAKGDEVQSARLMAARIHESRGNVFWSRARGAADHVSFLERLEKSGVGKSGDLAAAKATASEAIEQAKAEYTTAQEMLAQVQSRENQPIIDSYKANLEQAAAALNGKLATTPEPVADSPEKPDSDGTGKPASSASVQGLVGFDSPEELVQKAQEIIEGKDTFSNKLKSLLSMTRTATAEGKRARAVTMDLVASAGSLIDALNAKFGVEATAAALKTGGMNQDLPNYGTGNITDRSDTRATLEYQKPDGKTGKQKLIKVGDKWYSDGDDIDAEEKQQMAMMAMTMPMMKKAVQTVLPKIKAGDFATPEEAIKGLQAAMMSAMGSGAPKAGAGK